MRIFKRGREVWRHEINAQVVPPGGEAETGLYPRAAFDPQHIVVYDGVPNFSILSLKCDGQEVLPVMRSPAWRRALTRFGIRPAPPPRYHPLPCFVFAEGAIGNGLRLLPVTRSLTLRVRNDSSEAADFRAVVSGPALVEE